MTNIFDKRELSIIKDAMYEWQVSRTENGPFYDALSIIDKLYYLEEQWYGEQI